MAPRPKSSPSRSPSEVSEYIRALRKKYALTQESLAEVLGVSFASINRWENDQTKPTALALEKLHKLEASLGVNDDPSTSGPDAVPDNVQTDFTARPEAVKAIIEAERLAFAHTVNPAFATEISRIDPLPHQRIAV
ncbi:MAG: helix-turn-helix domain-containing protein, partial [Desulfovibrio sp.]|nr:helix-turn-helix domain-containing protein [Desulfovibrio sp.]